MFSKTAQGLRPRAAAGFARVVMTPANRGETHGPRGECVVTGFVINTTMRVKSQCHRVNDDAMSYEHMHESSSQESTDRLLPVAAGVVNLLAQFAVGPGWRTARVPLD